MRPPSFWQDPADPLGQILAPLGWVYAQATAWRLAHVRPWPAPVPVVCVGNLTAGGAGKTPVVRNLAARLERRGLRPHILSRGYGGQERGPVQVDPARQAARTIGDEPLLLARSAPCWVSVDRVQGARAIVAAGGGLILMDDGLQNPRLAQDARLVVVDGETGFGNRRAIPAGPLRERVASGLGRADALIVIGQDRNDIGRDWPGRLPLLRGGLVAHDAAWLSGARVAAFAGIGRPEKFRATLAESGANITAFRGFSDHHMYSERCLARLAEEAARSDATLVTTEKDWVRLTQPWRDRVRPIPVVIRWEDEHAVDRLVDRISTRR